VVGIKPALSADLAAFQGGKWWDPSGYLSPLHPPAGLVASEICAIHQRDQLNPRVLEAFASIGVYCRAFFQNRTCKPFKISAIGIS